jgi:hypothetical protein
MLAAPLALFAAFAHAELEGGLKLKELTVVPSHASNRRPIRGTDWSVVDPEGFVFESGPPITWKRAWLRWAPLKAGGRGRYGLAEHITAAYYQDGYPSRTRYPLDREGCLKESGSRLVTGTHKGKRTESYDCGPPSNEYRSSRSKVFVLILDEKESGSSVIALAYSPVTNDWPQPEQSLGAFVSEDPDLRAQFTDAKAFQRLDAFLRMQKSLSPAGRGLRRGPQ